MHLGTVAEASRIDSITQKVVLWVKTSDSLGGALAWIVGIVALFVPLSVWRYRRMS